jgi:hypothetical protein
MAAIATRSASCLQIIKFIKINGLQYNAKHDLRVYRRVAGDPFRIQVVIEGTGSVRVTLADEKGALLVAGDVQRRGAFLHELTFAKPGVRVTVQQADRSEARDIRLDVMAHAWAG